MTLGYVRLLPVTFRKEMSDIDHELEETALLEESGGENEIETETNETAGDEENDPVSSKTSSKTTSTRYEYIFD